MRVATVDFMKAFDSTSHQSLMKLLEKCGIESHYICLLRRLYAELKKSVSTEKELDVFEMRRKRNKAIFCPAYSSTRCSEWH